MTGSGKLTETAKLVMKAEDFRNLGMNQVAYIRPVQTDTASAFAIHAANGDLLDVIEDLAEARMETRKSELIPLIVH